MNRLFGKVALAGRIWLTYLRVVALLWRQPLHDVIGVLGRASDRAKPPEVAAHYSRAIHRTLRLGSRRPRCLPSALVLYRLLRKRNIPAELVIGLPATPTSPIAHAWVELDGRDIGPPPGRHRHEELARYP
ncbi:MAG TPA: lasso peptide biosynthesis B2 protein [Acidimicrobiia bacterium]|nr:lasso peptide biosynthesis B2 protein [Acidimicrobiia bacterium]